MWRIVCKITCAVLILSLLVSCSSITPGGGSSGASHGNIPRPRHCLYDKGVLIENNIEIETLPGDLEGTEYLQISGLASKDAEKRINDRLLEVFENMESGEYIPPYRGIQVKLRQFSDDPHSFMVMQNLESSFNGRLSVRAYCWADYQRDDEYFSYHYEVPLNFDLATGKELTLADLFYKDTDYISLLSERVDDYLLHNGYDEGGSEYYIDEIQLTSPFKGIKPEQKFHLYNDGTVNLLLDYDTPEFYTGFSPQFISLDMSDVLAVPDIDPGKLFDDKTVVYNLLLREPDPLARTNDCDYSNDNSPGKVSFGHTLNINKELPESIQQEMRDIGLDIEKAPIPPDDFLSETDNLPDDQDWHLDIHCYTNYDCVGDYIGLLQNYFYNLNTVRFEYGEYQYDVSLRSAMIERNRCFTKDGKPVELEDVFKRGIDAKAHLRKSLAASMKKNLPDADDSDISEVADMLIGHMNGFALGVDSMYISYDVCIDELELSKIPGFEDSYQIMFTNLGYRDIGCENLTIFG